MDIYLVNPDEVKIVPEQSPSEEKIDEEIEMGKQVPSPVKDIQAEPSRPTKEGEKVEGEQIAAQGTTPTVSSSGALAPMEVDPAPGSLASQPEQGEKSLKSPWLTRKKVKKLHH